MLNKTNNKKGFLVIEVLIAVSIIALSVLAFSNLSQKTITISRQAVNISKASFLLEEGVEIIRGFRDASWSNVEALSLDTNYYAVFDYVNNGWYLTTTPTNIDGFSRSIVLSSVNRNFVTGDIDPAGSNDANTKLITVNVSWQEGNVNVNKTISTYIINIL